MQIPIKMLSQQNNINKMTGNCNSIEGEKVGSKKGEGGKKAREKSTNRSIKSLRCPRYSSKT